MVKVKKVSDTGRVSISRSILEITYLCIIIGRIPLYCIGDVYL